MFHDFSLRLICTAISFQSPQVVLIWNLHHEARSWSSKDYRTWYKSRFARMLSFVSWSHCFCYPLRILECENYRQMELYLKHNSVCHHRWMIRARLGSRNFASSPIANCWSRPYCNFSSAGLPSFWKLGTLPKHFGFVDPLENLDLV